MRLFMLTALLLACLNSSASADDTVTLKFNNQTSYPFSVSGTGSDCWTAALGQTNVPFTSNIYNRKQGRCLSE
jgi:hypothetical protein